MTDSKKEPATPIPQSLKGLTAIVTGGAKGIGLGIAKDLASQGCRIAIWDIDITALAQATTELQQMGAEVFAQQVSVTSQDDVELAVARLHNTTGRVDILVNNAGIDADAPVLNYELETWRRVLRFNLEVPFRLSQHAAQHMVAHGGGSIINIASVLGFVGVNEGCSYSAAKHGLIGMTKGMAIEWSKQGVRVNAVAPGLIQTDMTANLWQADFGEAYVQSRIPQGRIGQPADIGGAVVFLASPAADFIHGQTIAVDGGFLAQ